MKKVKKAVKTLGIVVLIVMSISACSRTAQPTSQTDAGSVENAGNPTDASAEMGSAYAALSQNDQVFGSDAGYSLPETSDLGVLSGTMKLGTVLPYDISKFGMLNYPDYIPQSYVQYDPASLNDGYANDEHGIVTCDKDKPEYFFDLGEVQELGAFRISGYDKSAQSTYFTIFVSQDGNTWDEIGGLDSDCKYKAVLAQPIIEDESIYKADPGLLAQDQPPYPENYKYPVDTNYPNNSQDEMSTVKVPFMNGQYQNRTLLDAFGIARDVKCFASPQIIKDSYWYGYVDSQSELNYMFNYFLTEPAEARFVKINGYGNSTEQWYMWSSFTEVEFRGPYSD